MGNQYTKKVIEFTIDDKLIPIIDQPAKDSGVKLYTLITKTRELLRSIESAPEDVELRFRDYLNYRKTMIIARRRKLLAQRLLT